MIYVIVAVGGEIVPEVRSLGPKGRSDTPNMSDNRLCYDVCDSSSRGEIVPEVRLLGPKGSQNPIMARHG